MRRLVRLIWTMYPPEWRARFRRELEADLARRGAGATDVVDALVTLARLRWDAARAAPAPWEGLVRDVRMAFRTLARSPLHATVVVGTLGLALALTGAIFALADAFFLRPLPYAEPDRLVALWETEADGSITTVSPPNAMDWERDARTIGELAVFNAWGATLTGAGDAVRVAGSVASVDLFDVLGVQPALGPGFRPQHERPDSVAPARVVVLSHGLWVRLFGADPDVIGRTVELNDAPHEVVGVMPEGFRHARTFLGAEPSELWVPLGVGPSAMDRDARFLHVVGRLAPGATVADAREEMAALGASLARVHPETNAGRSVVVRPVDEQIFGDQRPAMLVLVAAAGLVLLIACVNTAGLLLARALGRMRDFAVRSALGSSRWKLLRGLMVEALVLALLGGVAGVIVLGIGGGILGGWTGSYLNPLADARVDVGVMTFTLLVATASGLLVGAVPAARLSGLDLRPAIAEGGAGLRINRLRAALVAVEIAVTVVLVFVAGLLGRSLLETSRVPPGFAVERTILFEVRAPFSGYQAREELLAFHDRLRSALEARPEIVRAGLVSDLPLTSENRGVRVTAPGSDRTDEVLTPEYHVVSRGYFTAAGITLLEGRDFEGSDDASSPWVAIVNRTLARELWGDGSAVGRTLRGRDSDVTVVGVVESTVDDAIDAPLEPRVYHPTGQSGGWAMWVVARTAGRPEDAMEAVRPTVAAVDPRVPVSRLTTMERHVGASLSTPRATTATVGLFGSVALALAALGIYGILAEGVTARSRELGVRAALGASRDSLVRLVLTDSARVAGSGLVAGVALSVLAGRALAGRVTGVSALEPIVLAASLLVVGLVWAGATWYPARRASRADPARALRT